MIIPPNQIPPAIPDTGSIQPKTKSADSKLQQNSRQAGKTTHSKLFMHN